MQILWENFFREFQKYFKEITYKNICEQLLRFNNTGSGFYHSPYSNKPFQLVEKVISSEISGRKGTIFGMESSCYYQNILVFCLQKQSPGVVQCKNCSGIFTGRHPGLRNFEQSFHAQACNFTVEISLPLVFSFGIFEIF